MTESIDGAPRAARSEVRPTARFAGLRIPMVRFATAQPRAEARHVSPRAAPPPLVSRSGDALFDWWAHENSAGKNPTFVARWGRMVRKGVDVDGNRPGFIRRQGNRALGAIASAVAVVVRPFGTAIKTALDTWPKVVWWGVNDALPKRTPFLLKLGAAVAVSTIAIPGYLLWGYIKGVVQTCFDFGAGFEGKV